MKKITILIIVAVVVLTTVGVCVCVAEASSTSTIIEAENYCLVENDVYTFANVTDDELMHNARNAIKPGNFVVVYDLHNGVDDLIDGQEYQDTVCCIYYYTSAGTRCRACLSGEFSSYESMLESLEKHIEKTYAEYLNDTAEVSNGEANVD